MTKPTTTKRRGHPSLDGTPGESKILRVRVTERQLAAYKSMTDGPAQLRGWLKRQARKAEPKAPRRQRSPKGQLLLELPG